MERQYSFIIRGDIEVFFTNESRIEFWNVKTDEKLFTIDPTDLAVCMAAHNCMTALWAQYDKIDEDEG